MIIGLSGYAGSGKDLFAQLAAEEFGAARFAFADALRVECAQAFRVDRGLFTARHVKDAPTGLLSAWRCRDESFAELLDPGWKLRDSPPTWQTPRRVLQLWGTEYRRKQAADYWLERAALTLARLRATGARGPVFVTDCRFGNEAVWIEGRGGQVWRIERAGVTPVNAHPSEVALDGWPFAKRIRNDGSVEDLRRQVIDLVSPLVTPPTPRAG